MSKTYLEDGVNLDAGTAISRIFADVCRGSFENSPYVNITDILPENFRGPRIAEVKNNTVFFKGMTVEVDGNGTKPVLSVLAKDTIGPWLDLIAMSCDDISRWGGIPTVLATQLDVATFGKDQNSEQFDYFATMAKGLTKLLSRYNLILKTGETAEVGDSVGSDRNLYRGDTRFLLGGSAIGVYPKEHMITGETITAGQYVVALKSAAFRCNGISSVRAAIARKFSYSQIAKGDPDAIAAIQDAALPAIPYCGFMTQEVIKPLINGEPGAVRVHGAAHITGDGIPGKFGKDLLFPRNLSAELNDLHEPPPIQQKCKVWRGMSDRGLFETWNAGQGMLLIVDTVEDAHKLIQRALLHGIEAKIVGRITPVVKVPSLIIHSKFHPGEVHTWEKAA